MKRYKLKITYFILLLLPLFASCTDEEIFQGSGVTEGVPTTVDISVGTATNTAKTRSALLESEERKIYNLYLWVFNSSVTWNAHVSIQEPTLFRLQLILQHPQVKWMQMRPPAWDC